MPPTAKLNERAMHRISNRVPKTHEDRAHFLKAVLLGVAVIVMISGALAFKDVRTTALVTEDTVTDEVRPAVNDVQLHLRGTRESRIRFQARQLFLMCSRDPGKTVRPDRVEDLEEVCEGYSTPEESLTTERRLQEEVDQRIRDN
jgi:hypothetical protein